MTGNMSCSRTQCMADNDRQLTRLTRGEAGWATEGRRLIVLSQKKKKTQQPSSGKKTPKEVKQYFANIASRSTQVDSGWWKFCTTTRQQLIRVYLFVLLVKNQGVQQIDRRSIKRQITHSSSPQTVRPDSLGR